MTPPRTPLAAIENTLSRHLLVGGGAVALVAGIGLGAPVGLGVLLGMLTAAIYYRLLGVQVRRQLPDAGAPRASALPLVVVSLAGRQAVCLGGLLLSLKTLGWSGFWAALAALLVARHWVIAAALLAPGQQVSPR